MVLIFKKIQNPKSNLRLFQRISKILLEKNPAFDLTTPDFSCKIDIEHLFDIIERYLKSSDEKMSYEMNR